MAKKRTAKRKIALATPRKKALTIDSAAEEPAVAPAPEPADQSAGVPPPVPELPATQTDSSIDPAVWGELHQHIVDIERNLGELRESMRAHDLIEAIEPVLMEIKNDVEASRVKSELTAAGLDEMRGELSQLHSQLVAVGRIGLRTEAQVDDLVGRLDAPEPEAPLEHVYIPSVPAWERPPVLLAAVVSVLVVSMLVYLQTGNVKLALGVLVVINLVGCTAVLVARKL